MIEAISITLSGRYYSSKIWLVAQREILTNLLNLRIPVIFAILVTLFIVSAQLMAVGYKQRVENWNINQEELRGSNITEMVFYTLPDGSFRHGIATGPDPAIPRPQPLSVLVKGIDMEMDRSIALGQRIRIGPKQNPSPIMGQWYTPDIFFFVKTILPLLALFFSLGVVVRKKEDGLLRQLLTLPISRRHLIIGEAIGAFISLLLPFTVVYLIAVVYLHLAHGLIIDGEEIARALLVFSISVLYMLVFVLLGLLISTLVSRTKSAAVAGLMAWATIVVLLPAASVLISKSRSPAPSYNHLDARLYETYNQVAREELSAYPQTRSIIELPNAEQVLVRLSEIDRQLTNEFLELKWSQVEQARTLSLLSPAGALEFGAGDLAGTGVMEYKSYLDFLRTGRDRMIDALSHRWDLPVEEGNKLLEQVIEQVKLRQREPLSLRESLRAAVPSVLSLGIWITLLGAATIRSFQRYDIR